MREGGTATWTTVWGNATNWDGLPTGMDYHLQYCQHRGTATNCNGILLTEEEGGLPQIAGRGWVVHIKSEGLGGQVKEYSVVSEGLQ